MRAGLRAQSGHTPLPPGGLLAPFPHCHKHGSDSEGSPDAEGGSDIGVQAGWPLASASNAFCQWATSWPGARARKTHLLPGPQCFERRGRSSRVRSLRRAWNKERNSHRAAGRAGFPFVRSKLSRAGWAGPKAGENTTWRFPNAPWRSVRPVRPHLEMRCGRQHKQKSEVGRHLVRTVAGLQGDMRREKRRHQVFRAPRGCGHLVLLKTREERAEARARAAVNATSLSPEDDWQSCEEYYAEYNSGAAENALALIAPPTFLDRCAGVV